MASVNLAQATSILARTVGVNLTSTSNTQILSNASGSNTLLKVNSLMISNVNGTSNADVTVRFHNGAALGGTATEIASTVSVPADGTIVIMDRSTGIYLDENNSLSVQAGTANYLKAVCCYEEIS